MRVSHLVLFWISQFPRLELGASAILTIVVCAVMCVRLEFGSVRQTVPLTTQQQQQTAATVTAIATTIATINTTTTRTECWPTRRQNEQQNGRIYNSNNNHAGQEANNEIM